jgi:hypothetical protein
MILEENKQLRMRIRIFPVEASTLNQEYTVTILKDERELQGTLHYSQEKDIDPSWELILENLLQLKVVGGPVQLRRVVFTDLFDDNIEQNQRFTFWACLCLDGNIELETDYLKVEAAVISIEKVE